MAVHKLTNAVVYMAQFDISGAHNMVELPQSVDKKDATTFGNTTRINAAGLYQVEAKGQGFTSSGTSEIETVLAANLAVADVPLSVMAQGGAAADRAYFTKILTGSVQPFGGQVGELDGFSWAASGAGGVPLVPGTVMAAKAARTSSSTSGTALQLGAVGAAQRIYAALHVFAASGTTPTLAVTVKSDNGVGFATPATQITFTTANAAGSQFSSAAGAIADDYWRVDWTIGGTTPSFTFAVVIGIF
jgi:hypothetical protein